MRAYTPFTKRYSGSVQRQKEVYICTEPVRLSLERPEEILNKGHQKKEWVGQPPTKRHWTNLLATQPDPPSPRGGIEPYTDVYGLEKERR